MEKWNSRTRCRNRRSPRNYYDAEHPDDFRIVKEIQDLSSRLDREVLSR